MPFFRTFAAAALRLVPPDGARVLDLAAGPGTLAFLAAPVARQIVALDFSRSMIARLEEERARAGVMNVQALVADGMSLPFPDASFDRAYSMFGLIFFPDRARGLAEVARVLAPGGRVALSSWVPLRRNPLLALILAEAAREVPGFPIQLDEAPLGEPRAFAAELEAAGFVDVAVHEVEGRHPARSVDELWSGAQRTALPLLLLRRAMGEAAWGPFAARIEARLRAGVTPELIGRPWTALVGLGRRPGPDLHPRRPTTPSPLSTA